MQDDRFLTKIFDSSRGPQPLSDSATTAVPSVLLQQGARRVPIVAAAALVLHALAWVFPLAVSGDLFEEFTRVWDWLPPTIAIAASTGILVATKMLSIPSRLTVKLGLLYQVVLSYTMAFSVY